MESINLLIVEGKDDEMFFKKFCECWEIDIKIEKAGGKPNLLNKKEVIAILNDARKTYNKKITRVIFICDADHETNNKSDNYGGFKKTKKSLEDMIEYVKNEYEHIESFSYFILPNNQDDGDLESLFLDSISDEFKYTAKCVEHYLECIKSKKSDLERINSNKTKAFSILSAIGCDDGIRAVGAAANHDKYWNLQSEKLQKLKQFFEQNLKSHNTK